MKNIVSRRRILTHALCIAAATPSLTSWADDSKPMRISRLTPTESRVIRLRSEIAPSNAVTRSRVVLTGLAADPRGNLIAASGDDNIVRIIGTRSMVVLRELHAHRDLVRTVAFNHDGSKLVSAGNDGQMVIWDRDGGFKAIRKLQNTPALACACFSPTGHEIAAVGFDDEVYVVDAAGASRPKLQCGCCDLRCVAYRHDAKLMVVGGRNGEIDLVDSSTHKQTDHHMLHDARVRDFKFMPGTDTLVSVGEDGRAVVFDTKSKTTVHRINVTSGRLFSVTPINDRFVAVAGSDNVIRIIDIGSGLVAHHLEGHDGSIASLVASDGWLFSGGYDATLRRWSVGRLNDTKARIAASNESSER